MSGSESRAMTLRGPEFLAAWHTLKLGEPPVELGLRPPGRTLEERDSAFARELARLRERGLAATEATGTRPCARLARALRLLAGAPLVHDLRLSTGLVALGALDGGSGAVLVSDRTGVDVRLVEVPGPTVPAALVELIGPVRTGRSRTVNIDAGTLDGARALVGDGSVWTLADRLVELGTPRVDAHALARMWTGVTACGQFGVLVRGGGSERRGRWMVGFHRTGAGHFVQLRRPAPSGRPYVTVAPVTADGLRAHLRGLAADLREHGATVSRGGWSTGSARPCAAPASRA